MIFRASNLSDVFYIHRVIASDMLHPFRGMVGTFPVSTYQFIVCLAGIIFIEIVHITQRKHGLRRYIAQKPIWIRWAVYYALILAIIFFGEFSGRQFIYFQF